MGKKSKKRAKDKVVVEQAAKQAKKLKKKAEAEAVKAADVSFSDALRAGEGTTLADIDPRSTPGFALSLIHI